MKLTCAIAMVCLATAVTSAEASRKLTKPEVAAKAWLTKMTSAADDVIVSKDKPLLVWLSANADSAACMKLGGYATLVSDDQAKTLKKCLQAEIKGRAIPDSAIRKTIVDVPITVVGKSHQKAMKDAAKGTTIVEATYGRNTDDTMSVIYVAVTADATITVVWVDSNETE